MMAGTAMFSVYGLVFSMFTLLPATIFLICSRKKKKHFKNKSFYIVSDTCQRKHTKCCGEDGYAYILTFSNGVEHTISIDDAAFVSVEKNQFDDWFYDQTELGDQFYLVYMDGDKKPTYIFHHKFCQLDTDDFEETNGKLLPKNK